MPLSLEDVGGLDGGVVRDFLALGHDVNGGNVAKVAVPTYGPTVTPDSTCEFQKIVVTDGVAFEIANPAVTNAGRRLVIDIQNSSGGVMAVPTWGTHFHLADVAGVQPADGKQRTVEFYTSDGTVWLELSRNTGDLDI